MCNEKDKLHDRSASFSSFLQKEYRKLAQIQMSVFFCCLHDLSHRDICIACIFLGMEFLSQDRRKIWLQPTCSPATSSSLKNILASIPGRN